MGVDRNANMISIGLAVGYSAYLVDSVRHALGKRVLDVGCGAGNTTAYLNCDIVVGLDSSDFYLEQFQRRLPDTENVKGDILDPATVKHLRNYSFDTIFSSNVLEHIENDEQALRNMHEILVPGGRLALIVPNYPWLFGVHDEDVGHFRRYDAKLLQARSQNAGFEVEQQFCINVPGIIWWYLNSSLRKKTKMEEGDAALVDRLIPLVRLLDKMFMGRAGLSIVQIARKSR